MTISIPSEMWERYYEAADFFIDDDHIGRLCTIIYPPTKESCVNCTFNNIGGTSTNVYLHGGPAPFNFGKCPMCGGNGYRESENTDTIRLRIYWRRKDWMKIADNLVYPDADAQIIGYMADVKKLKRAIAIKLVSESQHGEWKMVLAGDIFPHGFGRNRYFMAFLKRA